MNEFFVNLKTHDLCVIGCWNIEEPPRKFRGFIPLGCRKFTLEFSCTENPMIFKCWNVETMKIKDFQGPKNALIFLGTRRRFF